MYSRRPSRRAPRRASWSSSRSPTRATTAGSTRHPYHRDPTAHVNPPPRSNRTRDALGTRPCGCAHRTRHCAQSRSTLYVRSLPIYTSSRSRRRSSSPRARCACASYSRSTASTTAHGPRSGTTTPACPNGASRRATCSYSGRSSGGTSHARSSSATRYTPAEPVVGWLGCCCGCWLSLLGCPMATCPQARLLSAGASDGHGRILRRVPVPAAPRPTALPLWPRHSAGLRRPARRARALHGRPHTPRGGLGDRLMRDTQRHRAAQRRAGVRARHHARRWYVHTPSMPARVGCAMS